MSGTGSPSPGADGGLSPFAEGVWTAHRRLRFWGVETGTRMTVVRLRDGGLFVHSPVVLDGPTRAAVGALGPVRVLVAPSLFHHLSMGAWMAAWPDATAWCCPGLDQKRSDLRWTGRLGDEPRPEWAADLDQVHFGARSLENEVVFFHRATRTLVCADAVFHLSVHPSVGTRGVAFLLGNRGPGATWLERLLIRDRVAARRQVDRMIAWDAERIALAHGGLVSEGGGEVLRQAYAWL